MSTAPLSIILLPTLNCNVACDYCFEQKSAAHLTAGDLRRITVAILDHMQATGAQDAEIYWQGGEALLLGPVWFESAHELMGAESASRGRAFHHYLQSNLIGYGPHWNPIIRTMFEGAVGTSMDYPNDHRRLRNGSTEQYTEVWLDAVRDAQEAGLKVTVIAVLHAGSLRAGAEEFLRFFADSAGIDDVQVNLPFPGGPSKGGGDILEPTDVSRFLGELLDVWLTQYSARGLRLAPFTELMNQYLGRPARLPCIWQPNCASQFMTIDARGHVALCDCWVTSYPEYRFGNVLGKPCLAEILGESEAHRAFIERPVRLMDMEDCASCPYLSLCHGGCPVRTFTSKGTIEAKDPYCEVYKAIFVKCREIAGAVVHAQPIAGSCPKLS